VEVFLGEEARGAVDRGEGLGDEGRDPGLGAGFDLLGVVIAHVGHRFQSLHSQRVLGPLGHRAKVGAVGRVVGDFMVEDELVLAVDGHLDVIGDVGAVAFSGGDGAAVGVGQGDLGLTGLVHLLAQGSQLPLALPEDLDLLLGAPRR
jgi:hypothetical protein